jgi:hypothetical protein
LKRAFAVLATAVLLVGALYMGRGSDADLGDNAGPAADSPAACLDRMFSAAEKGDLAGWLNCFTGQERERLSREIDAQPKAEFTIGLQEAVRTLKGRAISNANRSASPGGTALLSVERIYAQHTERQTYGFRREADGWRIDSLGQIEKHQPPIAYGTPVFDLNPPEEQ